MIRKLSFILCVLLIVSLMGGCKNDESAYVPTGDALVMDDGQLAQTPTNPNTEEQELTLTYYPTVTMNPLSCNDFTNRTLFSLLYQGLFSVNRDYSVEPQLCKQYAFSEDMKSYTFHLDAATFSDGTAVTANDVVATYQAAKENGYYAGRFVHITEISAANNTSVVFTLDTPMENLPILLDIPVLKATEVTSEHPLGTGPYLWDAGNGEALLRRRTDWWCTSDLIITAPAISLIEAESNPQIRDSFEFDALDLVCANPGSDRYTDYRCDYELWDCENGVFMYLSCNMDSAIFSVPEVRSALTYAIDRETIAAENYRGFGTGISLPASPNSPYYSQVQAEKYAYDGGDTFRQAVADAELVGKPLIFLVNGEDTMRARIGRTICKAMTAAGFVVEIRELTGDAYTRALQIRDYDLYLGQTRLSANMDLSAFFATTGALSYGGINDVGIYTLCLESLANHGNYYSLHQAVMDDGRLCPVVFSSYAIYATRGLLTGLTPARDNVFCYSLGKTMEQALIRQ